MDMSTYERLDSQARSLVDAWINDQDLAYTLKYQDLGDGTVRVERLAFDDEGRLRVLNDEPVTVSEVVSVTCPPPIQ